MEDGKAVLLMDKLVNLQCISFYDLCFGYAYILVRPIVWSDPYLCSERHVNFWVSTACYWIWSSEIFDHKELSLSLSIIVTHNVMMTG